jgi:TPR repeat protein
MRNEVTRTHKFSRCKILLTMGIFTFTIPQNLSGQRKVPHRTASSVVIIKGSELDYHLLESFQLMLKANEGDAPAQHELGLRHLSGKGFSPDSTKAAYWLQKAATQNYILAHYNLGVLYHNGWGVPWNPFEAYRHFSRAAEQRLPEAEFVVGLMLTENLVVPSNWESAYGYVKRSADQHFEPATKALKEFEKRGIPLAATAEKREEETTAKRPLFVDFNVDTSNVDDWELVKGALVETSPSFRKSLGISDSLLAGTQSDTIPTEQIVSAADAGSPEAATLLGRLYERGQSFPQDRIRAAAYYLRAIRLESPRAPELLWGLVAEQDLMSELEKKKTSNDAEAQFVWAGLVAMNVDQRLSGEQALGLLQSSSNRNYMQAIIDLGMCYHSGRWVERDRARALQLWQLAADRGNMEAEIRLTMARLFAGEGTRNDLIALLTAASERGSLLADVAIGYCTEHGIGVERKKGEAARLYRNAAQRGSETAYLALRRLHDEIRPPEKEFQLED